MIKPIQRILNFIFVDWWFAKNPNLDDSFEDAQRNNPPGACF